MPETDRLINPRRPNTGDNMILGQTNVANGYLDEALAELFRTGRVARVRVGRRGRTGGAA